MQESDVNFHEVITRAGGNRRLNQVMTGMADTIYRFRYEYIRDDLLLRTADHGTPRTPARRFWKEIPGRLPRRQVRTTLTGSVNLYWDSFANQSEGAGGHAIVNRKD